VRYRRHDAESALVAAAGRVLAGIFFLLGKIRHGERKALHPRGELVRARLRRHGISAHTGVEWLDEFGVDDVVVRLSRSIGLPGPLPDVLGFAMRVPAGTEQYGDVLLATTGTGALGRFLLRPARSAQQATYSSLFPYRTAAGPLLLAAFAIPDRLGHFELAWARLTGTWTVFATLELFDAPEDASDAGLSFDPILNVVPGLEPYEWSRQLRELSYAAARRSRAS
jgi:hypothetical protein